MKSKTVHKRVGKVDIFEFEGDLRGQDAESSKSQIKHDLQKESSHGVLFHAGNLKGFDDKAVKAIIENARATKKNAILSGDASLCEKLHKTSNGEKVIPMFQTERVATFYLAGEFVEGCEPEIVISDRRRFPRLKAAKPLHFSFENDKGARLHFFAIVTNLSRSGLYAEFMESRSKGTMLEYLNVYDLKMLDLELHLTPTETVKLRAKLVRVNMPKMGVAMEFYESEENEKARFDEWVDQEESRQGETSASK